MHVLVTGHKGYIGSAMIPLLIKEGYQIVGLDTDLYKSCTFGNSSTEILEIKKDIRDIIYSDLKGFDAVIHLAALSNDPLGNFNPELTYEINYKASVNLARLARQAGVSRFLFSSSCSLYGAAGDKVMDENDKFNPITPYGHAKILVENEVSKLATKDFSPVFLRNTTAYGISPGLRLDVVLNDLVGWATTTKQIYLKSDGTPWRPLVHIEDIAAAFIAALKAPRDSIHNQAYNVGINEDNFQINDLANIVKSTIPDCKITYAEDAGPDKRSYKVDFSKIKSNLSDFKPQWNVKLGTIHLYESFKKIGLSLEEFKGPKYRRIDQINHLIKKGLLDHNLRWIKA